MLVRPFFFALEGSAVADEPCVPEGAAADSAVVGDDMMTCCPEARRLRGLGVDVLPVPAAATAPVGGGPMVEVADVSSEMAGE